MKYFDDYVDRFGLPVHCGVEVRSVEKLGTQYIVRTIEGDYEGDNVVIATGLYQSPRIPRFSADIAPNILQIHSSGIAIRGLCRLAQYWLSVPGSLVRRSRKSSTRAGGRSISQSAALGASLGVIAEGTSPTGSLAWGCLIRKSTS